jgi:hypothetical protein
VITGSIEKWLQRGCNDPIDDFVGLITATGVGIRYAFEQLNSERSSLRARTYET